MEKLLRVVLFLLPFMALSQIVDPPDVKCYDIIEKDSYTVLDSLHIPCGTTLLLQDNSTLVIRGGITGDGIIKYGDVGDDDVPF